ncbi:MAG: hypothetical protein NE330_16780 [Lentisphaeraceae bacterium]|nr:hypothetical protein [Lentisphaeraceae bacterium]
MFKLRKIIICLIVIGLSISSSAEQFTLFDQTFTYENKDAIPTKSHLKLMASELAKETPKNWSSPLNYADGKVYIRVEVLEKPKGNVPTHWSLCYIANKGQNGSGYACASSPRYTKLGVYEVTRDMKKLWQKDKVVWSEGLKAFTLVVKGPKIEGLPGGKSHAHNQPDLDKFFPLKIRFTLVQISEGAKFDPSKVAVLQGK